MSLFARSARYLSGLLLVGSVSLAQTPPAPPTPPPFPGTSVAQPAARPSGGALPGALTPGAVPVQPVVKNDPNALKFDSTAKSVELKQGETKGIFQFSITNVTKEEITISGIHTSCGCTAGKLPRTPWVMAPGESGNIDITMDMTGKIGKVNKTATISSSAGPFILSVSSTAAPLDPSLMRAGDRTKNLQVAAADRQAVFRNDCATCHVHPATGKVGKQLFDAACGICHDAENRATMVPPLRDTKRATDENYWTKWISEGRTGSLMPAFALNHGGILTDEQIKSLVTYLEGDFKKEPPPLHAKAAAPAIPLPTATPAVAPPPAK